MKIPLVYSLRNLWIRRFTTLVTMLGVGLVVFVFVAALMLAAGLRKTLISTGSDDNAIAIRRASQSEVQSAVSREQANILRALPEVATKPDGTPIITNDLVVLISLTKRGTSDPANVVIRGVSPLAMEMRPQVRLVEGRMWQTGTWEIIIGRSIHQRYEGADIGKSLRFGGAEWQIVGIFDAGNTGFDSEIWGDVDILMPAFRRPVFSSVTVRLRSRADFESLKARVENDPRLTVDLKRETDYYAEQSRTLAAFLNILGTLVSFVFSFGAMIGAMITMYAAVSNRMIEVGTLRALGFRRRSILGAFLVEATLLSFFGGVIGLAASSFLQLIRISTINWDTFSELAFNFSLTPGIAGAGLIFAIVMGIAGGFLPAVRAARLKIVDTLRAE